ncbi:MAG TPA: hypothetical protein VM242_02775 [Acidimicrobiales bacterium]|nr:hypothetical protein [Acidimicrobiales bacterium]
MDPAGRDPATGRPPRWPGHPTPLDALAGAPVAAWPVAVVGVDGTRLSLARALGAGGERVERLVDELAGKRSAADDVDVAALARRTPAGVVDLPVAVVDMAEASDEAGRVDAGWLDRADAVRAALRRDAVAAGREAVLEAALHIAVLVATERLDPAGDDDVDAHVASGAQLWLVAGAVAAAVAGAQPDPFAAWARLVSAGWWPVGPAGKRLVVGAGRP